ncbi:hypothetical protein [Streptomyces nitrosporeus]|uniref:hypothetical protein n=1 Tax=Streptomyces nitrosporeus TaxID=28894 RepID=UPI00331AF37D
MSSTLQVESGVSLAKATDVVQDPAERAEILAERLFAVQLELDAERAARRETTEMLNVMFEVSTAITRDLGEAEAELRDERLKVELLRESLAETRTLRDARERALRGEVEFWREEAAIWQLGFLFG